MSLPMSRRNIADYLGLQIETVSCVVSRLQCDGVLRFIGKTHREIAIPDPLAQGRFASDPVLAEIGARHNASAAQVALKWLLDQDGVAAIPKASRRESQQANLDALKITLDDADRKKIAALPKDKRCVNPGFAPAWD